MKIFVKFPKYKPPVSNTLFTYLPINTQSILLVYNHYIWLIYPVIYIQWLLNNSFYIEEKNSSSFKREVYM